MKYCDKNANVSLLGSTSTYLPTRNYKLDKGRLFTESEMDSLARVAIVGPKTVEKLLGEDEPLGAVIKVNGTNFRVIGVTKSKGDQGWFNPDNQVMIPVTTAM